MSFIEKSSHVQKRKNGESKLNQGIEKIIEMSGPSSENTLNIFLNTTKPLEDSSLDELVQVLFGQRASKQSLLSRLEEDFDVKLTARDKKEFKRKIKNPIYNYLKKVDRTRKYKKSNKSKHNSTIKI